MGYKVSTEIPVVIIHQSGHLGVANSKALELNGITAETKNPEGGVFRRKTASSEPNGVMEEYAFFQILSGLMGTFDHELNVQLAKAGTDLFASFVYTTAQEGRLGNEAGLEALKSAAARNLLSVDVAAYPDVLVFDTIEPSRTYHNRFRIAGVKLTIDGSPQGKTAWLTRPYHVVPDGLAEDYSGYAAIDEKQPWKLLIGLIPTTGKSCVIPMAMPRLIE